MMVPGEMPDPVLPVGGDTVDLSVDSIAEINWLVELVVYGCILSQSHLVKRW